MKERMNAIETTKVRLKMMDYEMTFKAEDYMIETKKKDWLKSIAGRNNNNIEIEKLKSETQRKKK